MKILMVHNYYGSENPSGENLAFDEERNMLRNRGHNVLEFTRHSDEIRSQGAWGLVKGALSTPWNRKAAYELRQMVAHFKPDVVHAHNTFPLISASVFHSIGPQVARVLTLHNYRLFCPAGSCLREGSICTDCLDTRTTWPSIRHGCYRDSRIATLPLALSVELHRAAGTWSQQVDAFIALSEFQRRLMVSAGLPSDQMHVKPNFYPGNPAVRPWHKRQGYVVFAGRLTQEKGLKSLLLAWRAWGADAPELRLVGDGNLKSELEQFSKDLPVRFLGQLPSTETFEQIAAAHLLVLPSESFEGFPMVLREAFAFGTPVAVSRLGPLPSIVEENNNGVLFEPCNPESILTVVRNAWEAPHELERLAIGARKSFDSLYNVDSNYRSLIKVYENAIDVSRRRMEGNR